MLSGRRRPRNASARSTTPRGIGEAQFRGQWLEEQQHERQEKEKSGQSPAECAVNELQLLIIAAYFVTPPAIRGAILGIAIALKPNVAIALPLVAAFDFAHDRRKLLPEMLGVVAGGTAAVAVSAAYFRSATAWIAWLRAARTLSQNVYARETGNVARPSSSAGMRGCSRSC